jgi:hypothetical protein
MLLCPPEIPHDMARAGTRAAAVGSLRLTAWAMARPDSYPFTIINDRLFCLMVTVPGYRSRGRRVRFLALSDFLRSSYLEHGPLSLVSTIEQLLGRNNSGSGLESREFGRRDPLRWPATSFCPQKLSLTLPTSGGRSVGVVRSRTQATEFVFVSFAWYKYFPLTSLFHISPLGRREEDACVCTRTFTILASFAVLILNVELYSIWIQLHKHAKKSFGVLLR